MWWHEDPGVAMEQPGKTAMITADTFAEVEALKAAFTAKDPDVKLDAPVATEI